VQTAGLPRLAAIAEWESIDPNFGCPVCAHEKRLIKEPCWKLYEKSRKRSARSLYGIHHIEQPTTDLTTKGEIYERDGTEAAGMDCEGSFCVRLLLV
jgi:hypothetical protein